MAETTWSRTPIEESEDFIEDLEVIDTPTVEMKRAARVRG